MTARMDERSPAPGTRLRGRRRLLALAVITMVGVGLRVAFALTSAPDLPPASDSNAYREVAANLAAGDGHSERRVVGTTYASDADPRPSATHPPVHSFVLAAGDLVGLDSLQAQRMLLSVVAGMGIFATGLLGFQLAGVRVGLVASAITAVHPILLQHAGMRVSEATYLTLITLTLLGASIAFQQGTARWYALAGALVGVCALTRTEAVLLFFWLLVPLAAMRSESRLRLFAISAVACVAVIAPWLVRNQAQMGTTTISLNSGVTLSGANCPATYRGESIGGFDTRCAYQQATVLLLAGVGRNDRVTIDSLTRKAGISYAKRHKDRLLAVAAARTVRVIGIGHFDDSLDFDVAEGRSRTVQRVGYLVHLVVLALAVTGALLWMTGRIHLQRGAAVVLGSVVGVALTTGVMVYGSTRLRVAAEPALAVLAAAATVHLVSLLTSARRGEKPSAASTGAPGDSWSARGAHRQR